MARSASRTPNVTRHGAEARFRELIDELKLLTVSFPHLRDAFGSDDLPVSFLLKRGADRAARRASRPAKAGVPKRNTGARTKKK